MSFLFCVCEYINLFYKSTHHFFSLNKISFILVPVFFINKVGIFISSVLLKQGVLFSYHCSRENLVIHLSFFLVIKQLAADKSVANFMQISNFASMWFILLFVSIATTGILELRWSGVSIEDWWRNEQFWVIGGTSAHLFAVFQGLLKVLAGIDTNFTVTSKASDEDGDFAELYVFKWTSLLIPPTTVLIVNLVGIVAGVSYAVNSGYQSWGPLFGKLFFAIWVIAHLYPFLKGLLGRQNRTPTIVIVWSILLASIFSLLWVRIDPFTSDSAKAAANGQCGINC
jgi:hypothetical protein